MATEEQKIIIDVQLKQKEALKRAQELTKVISKDREELKKWRKQLKEGGEGSDKAAKEVERLSRQIKDNSKELRQSQKEYKASDNSINALRARLAKIKKEWANVNTATAEGRKEFNRLTKESKEVTDQLKALEKSTGDTRRNVGNYKEAVTDALKENALFAETFGDLGVAMDSLSGATKSLRVALIALPFAAILAAVTAFLTKTEEGQRILRKLQVIAQVLFTNLAKLIAPVGEAIVNFFNDPLENSKQLINDLVDLLKENLQARMEGIANTFSLLGQIIQDVFSGDFEEANKKAGELGDAAFQAGTGVKDVSGKLKEGAKSAREFADSVNRAAEAAGKLADREEMLRKRIRALNREQASQQRIAEENRKLRDDETASFQERIEANERALEAERRRTKAQRGLTQARIELLENERKKQGILTEEQKDELSNLYAELELIQEDFAGRTTENLTEQNALIKEQLQARAKLQELQLEESLLREEKSLNEQKRIRLSILAKQEEAALIGLKEGAIARQAVTQEFLNKRLELEKEYLEREREELPTELRAQPIVDAEMLKTETIKVESDKRNEIRSKEAERERARAKAEIELAKMRVKSAKETTDSIISLFGEESDAGKLAILAKKGLTVAEITLNLSEELSNIFAANSIFPEPLGSIVKAVQAGIASARAASNIQRVASVSPDGFAQGGYTGGGGKYEPAGIVHKNEFVVPSNRVSALGGASAVSKMTGTPIGGFAMGGMVAPSMTRNAEQIASTDAISDNLNKISVQVAVTDIKQAEDDYNKIQARVNA